MEISAPTTEGGHHYDDILGFPGDGFQDMDSDTELIEVSPSGCPISTKKRKASVPVPPDEFVDDRIKTFKKTVCGPKCTDNEGTEMLRGKLYQDTVQSKIPDTHSHQTKG